MFTHSCETAIILLSGGLKEGTKRGSRGQLGSHCSRQTRDGGVSGAERRGQSREMVWRQSRWTW